MKFAWGAALLVATSGTALADWQYTKWGMTVEQVIAQSGGTAHTARDEKDKRIGKKRRLAVGEVTIGTTKFPVDFYFEDKQLRLIRYDLGLNDGCAEKEALFLETYGSAEPRLTSTEFPGRHLIYAKSRSRTWQTEQNDRLKFQLIWLERPDLPGKQSKSICWASLEPPGAEN